MEHDPAHERSPTTEARPDTAAALFGAAADRAEQFVEHLATSGVEWGLVGPREVPRLWSRHLLNCVVVAELIPHGVRVVDVGSGAGLPGLVLAIARPDLQIALVEPLQRRATWLTDVARDLALPVQVHRARAEALAGSLSGAIVTARAVASLATLLEWTLPLTDVGGHVLAIKGRTAADELVAARTTLQRWHVAGAEVVTCGVQVLATPTTVVRVPRGTHVPTGPSRGRRRPGR